MTTEAVSPIDQPSEPQDASPAHALILDVVVTQPGATCNVYQHDRERGALRLEQVLQVDVAQPADLARYPLEHHQSALERIGKQEHTVPSADKSPSLPVLLVRSAAIAPGAWVSARLIGALRVSSSRDESLMEGWTLVAVPVSDASQHIATCAQLPAESRTRLAAMLAGQDQWENGTEISSSGDMVEWMEAPEAARYVRQARATWRQRQRQQQAQTPAP